MDIVSNKRLAQFVVQAKIAGYATAGGEQDRNDYSKELAYEESELRYLDRYFGFNPFSGMEVVWSSGHPVWSMTYYGEVISSAVPQIEIYLFLKDAMKLISEAQPFRGPASFKKEHFEYSDLNQGTLDNFSGKERILYEGQEVYRLSYIGGKIRLKEVV